MRKAVLKLTNWRDAAFVPYLLANSAIDLLNDIFITKGQGSFKWYETVKRILVAVGNPPIAVADNNAATAMGARPPRPGSDPVTPLARVRRVPAQTPFPLLLEYSGRPTLFTQHPS